MEDDGRPGLCSGAGVRQLLSRRAGCDAPYRNAEIYRPRREETLPGKRGAEVERIWVKTVYKETRAASGKPAPFLTEI